MGEGVGLKACFRYVVVCFGVLFGGCCMISWIGADSSHNLVYRNVVMSSEDVSCSSVGSL